MLLLKKFLLITIFLFVLVDIRAEEIRLTGICTRIFDGDTIAVRLNALPENSGIKKIISTYKKNTTGEVIHEIRVRIYGIDAPEHEQPYSAKAREYLKSLIYGKEITIISDGTISYDRIVGKVFIKKYERINRTTMYQDISKAMLKAGMAWHYAFFDRTAEYAQLQIEAKNRRNGLWGDLNPVPPWKFRKNKKSAKNN